MNKPVAKPVRTRGAVLYTRVSTDEQSTHGTSPDVQRDSCLLLAAQMGLPVVEMCPDMGVSGVRYSSRPGIQRALKLIEAGEADTLIATKIDRIGRSAAVILDIASRVRKAGGQLVTSDARFDDTPMGQFTLTMFAGMAELERNNIRERTMGGAVRRAQEGIQPQRSRSPFGLHVITKLDKERGLYPDSAAGSYVPTEAAPLVAEMFTRYASGQATLAGLCRDLNARKVPTPRSAAVWWPSTVQAILVNPAYKGEPAYGRTISHTDEGRLSAGHPVTGRPLTTPRYRQAAPDGHAITLSAPPLVTEAIWEEAQWRMDFNRTYQGGNPQRARMLSGRAFLSCGHAAVYQPAWGRSPAYYHCGVRQRDLRTVGAAGVRCESDFCRADLAERSVAFAFLSAASNPQAMADARHLYEARMRPAAPLGRATDARREMADLDRAMAEMAQEDVLAVQAQIAGMRAGASPDAYAAVFADLAARRKDMADRRGVLAQTIKPQQRLDGASGSPRRGRVEPGDDLALKALADAALVLSAPDVPGETKRDLVGMVVERVICRRDGAEVHFLPGFGPQGDEAATDTLTDTIQTGKTVWIKADAGQPSGSDTE